MIEVLRVQNYKSLKDVNIHLKPLTVLVGPNAAGKSNILDCLAFIAEVAGSGLNKALEKRGSFADLVWAGDTKRSVSVSIAGQFNAEGSNAFEYSIKIGGRDPVIVEESGNITDLEGKLFTFHREGTEVKYESSTTGLSSGGESALIRVKQAAPLREAMLNWSFYDFFPSRMRSPQPVAKQTRLNTDGSNVATLLHWIYSEETEVFRQVEELLKTAVPEVDRLLSPLTEDGKTYIAWRETNISGRIPAWNMSEGSVRLVAVLLALLVPKPPLLVAFETPEVHLHPYQMEYLADILKSGSQRLQVLATTHSPYLVNYLPLENMLIVRKQAGETKVEPVEDSAHLRAVLKSLGLGEAWYAGHLGGVP